MKIELLPSACGAASPAQYLTSFLVNDVLAVDCGSTAFALSLTRLQHLRDVVLTHAHLDHFASLPVLLAQAHPTLDAPIRVHATAETIEALRRHVFNGVIWPDYEQVPLPGRLVPSLEFHELPLRETFDLHGVRLLAVPVQHPVPTVGLVLEDARAAIVLTSTTRHTEEIWREVENRDNVAAVFVDVAMSDEQEAEATETGHLTPRLLDLELARLERAVPVFAVNLKPNRREKIVAELRALDRTGVHVAEAGRPYEFPAT